MTTKGKNNDTQEPDVDPINGVNDPNPQPDETQEAEKVLAQYLEDRTLPEGWEFIGTGVRKQSRG